MKFSHFVSVAKRKWVGFHMSGDKVAHPFTSNTGEITVNVNREDCGS